MISDFEEKFPVPENDVLKVAWERAKHVHAELVELIESRMLFSGIGQAAESMNCPSDFPVVDDVVKAANMLYLDEADCHFMSYIESPLNRDVYLHYRSIFKETSYEYNINRLSMKFASSLERHVWRILEEHQVEQELESRAGIDYADVYTMLSDPTQNFLKGMIQAAWHGGLDKHPLAKRLMEAYQTGGMPVGWVGPEYEDGGDPRECVQLLHFGCAEDEQSDQDPLS